MGNRSVIGAIGVGIAACFIFSFAALMVSAFLAGSKTSISGGGGFMTAGGVLNLIWGVYGGYKWYEDDESFGSIAVMSLVAGAVLGVIVGFVL